MSDENKDLVLESADDPDARTVVVTGASSGIGYGVVQELIAHGYQVIGTVRKAEDAERLRSEFGGRMRIVLMTFL